MLMLEDIITTAVKLFALMSITIFAVEYYVHKRPLIESVGSGLSAGLLVATGIAAAGTTAVTYPYQQLLIVICIALGIVIFLVTTVSGYYVRNLPLKDSIREGLIMVIWTILALIFVKLFVFLRDLIV
jgi:hypothetical protein